MSQLHETLSFFRIFANDRSALSTKEKRLLLRLIMSALYLLAPTRVLDSLSYTGFKILIEHLMKKQHVVSLPSNVLILLLSC